MLLEDFFDQEQTPTCMPCTRKSFYMKNGGQIISFWIDITNEGWKFCWVIYQQKYQEFHTYYQNIEL